jgi:UDP-N-acetylmuramyl pentapeptide synthase
VIPLELAEVEPLGRLEAAPWADAVTGVQIDSRRISEGDLFVAVNGGRDFVKHAFARGAAAALVPDDALGALARLGRAVRDRSTARVVGITGSTGKTSTRDILAALCRERSRPRPTSTTSSAFRSRSADWRPTRRSASSSWGCAASGRSPSCARSRSPRSV